MREVRERVAVRVAIDETAAEPGALAAGVADAVCLKISRCGGIAGLLAAATLVRATGAEVYLASTLDGPLGIAAALHAAAALASRGPLPPCGLATLGLFEEPRRPAAACSDGAIARARAAPGLGVAPLSLRDERQRASHAPRGALERAGRGRPATTASARVGQRRGHPPPERDELARRARRRAP